MGNLRQFAIRNRKQTSGKIDDVRERTIQKPLDDFEISRALNQIL